jgi:hypothetical protein
MNSNLGGEVIFLDWCAKAQYWYYPTLRKAKKMRFYCPRFDPQFPSLALLETPSRVSDRVPV